ncbi:hypothetical protein Bca4012_005982 [Brassica carinata]
MASGRKRLRNLAAETHPTYGETFLDRTDPSASSSGTASAQENVTESQSQGRSSAQEYVPPAQYVHLAQYELPPYSPQYEADFQPQYDQPPPQKPPSQQSAPQQPPPRQPAPAPEAPPTPPALHPDLMAGQEGAPPSLSRIYKTRHQHSDGTFVHPEAERIYNDVKTWIQEVQTQLSQQNPEAEPVQLSTVEQDKIFEHV